MIRVSVELDDQLQPLGCSYEVLGAEGPTSLWCQPVGPFDTPAEAFETALEDARSYIGAQATLF